MASDNEIEVGFGVDTSKLEAGAKTASDAVKNSTEQMKSAFAQLTEAVIASHESIAGAMEGISAGFEKFNGILKGVTAAIVGSTAIKEFVKDAAALTAESAGLGKAMGLSTTEASYLKSALAEVGLSSESAMTAANKITMALVKNEDAFKSLGVATRDQNGNFLSTGAVMEATNARLREFGEGTDRNVEGMKIYGRSWSEIAPLVNKFKGVTDEAREEAESLNLVVGQESVDAMAAYKKANNGVGEVLEGLKNTIGQALMPLLTDMAEWFKSIGPTAIEMTRIAVGAVATAFNLLDVTVYSVWEVVKTVIQTITVGLVTAATVIERLLNRDWAGAKAAWQLGGQTIADDWSTNMTKIAVKADDTVKRIVQAFSGKQTETKAPKQGLHSEGGEQKDEKPKSEMAEFKAQLQAKLEAEGDYFKDSTDESLAYWEGVKAMGLKSEADKRAVNTEIFNLTKKTLGDQKTIQTEAITSEMALERARVATAIDTINAKQAAGKMSMSESLAQIKALHDAEYAAEVDLLNQKKAILGTTAIEAKKIDDELVMAGEKNNLTVIKDAAAAAAEVRKGWEKAFAPIVQAMDTAVKGIISGTTTMQRAFDNIFNSIFVEVMNVGVKVVANWAATEAAKTAASLTGAQLRKDASADEAIEAVAKSAWAALKQITNDAATAFSGAFSSTVGIPIVGPELAPGVAAGAMGAVMAAGGSIASARGGYDIPAGLNPMTQLHEREMVLPQAQADAVRNMASGGGGGGDVHMHVHTQSTQDFQTFLSKNSHVLAPALRRLGRNFSPSNA